jgi:AbrB family looped-hinge helix DNA binding protein
MAHKESSATVQYQVQLGDRGRLVLPAKLRAKLGLRTGERLLVSVDPSGEMRLATLDRQARRFRGALKAGARGGRPSEDLIADRRREAAREDEERS